MSNTNIERNKLDYLLSDIMPVEVSELFSYSKFYDFLLSRHKELDSIERELNTQKSKNNEVLFNSQGMWATMPLKYNILKGTDSSREINIVQPLSALNIYLFVESYQKEILSYFKNNCVFSLRFHRKNNDLFYKNKVNKVTSYFERTAKRVNRAILQQTGAYFKIYKYNSISSFMNSRLWQMCNFKYSNFAKADYKTCFGSIYTHAYKWIIEQNVIDSKNSNNSNLFIVVDRILQNINCYSSNGLIVGPEFSRMMAELLLQTIDNDVSRELTRCGLQIGKDYRVFRYVDDLFVFSTSPEIVDKILFTFEMKAHKYLLQLNEAKTLKCQTPVVLSAWLSDARVLADRISDLFYSTYELRDVENSFLLKRGFISLDRLKDDFTKLINKYPDDKRYIVSFILSTMLNHISLKKDGYALFEFGKTSKAFVLLELAMYVMSYCPCFEHNQKVISMMVYMDDELLFKENEENRKRLQALVHRYSFVFERGNINDLCNWFVFMYEHGLSLRKTSETIIEKKLITEDNPILWANYLIYSRYYQPYFSTVLSRIEQIIQEKLSILLDREMMAQREFWYIIVFCNCPYLSPLTKGLILQRITQSKNPSPVNYYDKLKNLLCDFMCLQQPNLFFMWGYYKFNASKQMTYRTYKRTLFKQYKNKRNVELYGSLDS